MKNQYNAMPVDELATPLIRYLSKKVRNNEDANDLAQEALLRMYKFQQSGSALGNARAFLFKTANNLVIDQMRRAQVHGRFLDTEMPAGSDTDDGNQYAPSAEQAASAEQQLNRIYEVIDTMPPKVRQAFLLHRSNNLSYTEIAADMGVSTSMVEKYIARALKLLRKALQ